MTRFVVSRLMQAIPVLLISTIMIFLLIHLTPGDPIQMLATPRMSHEEVERLRAIYGLDQPLPIQYVRWLGRIIRGDFGESVLSHIPVSEILWRRFGNTIRLTTTSFVISMVGGLLLGILAGVRPNSLFDFFSTVISVGGFCIPPFWLGLMLILIFSVKLHLLPAGGGDSNLHIVLPSISLGFSYLALIARMTRTCMLDVLREDYITTARSKGLLERRVVLIHALKNALIPVITVIGLQFGSLLAGATVTETIFAWPGVGSLLVESILKRDFPLIQGTLLITACSMSLVNLVVDILYGLVDPRIRVG